VGGGPRLGHEDCAGFDVVPRKSGGGTDGNLFNAKGIPCVALSTGMVDEHATSEHIVLEDMLNACKVLVTIVTQEPEGSAGPA
jgi:tripeptide aminopeptidase